MQVLPGCVVSASSFNNILASAAQHSGLDNEVIAERIHICAGYMSRFMRGIGQQWAKRMVSFMRETQSLAPLQWMAEQMGCDVVLRDSRAAEVAALRARLSEIERAA
ncbi:MAG: hypothetical protein IV107_24025 [Paucibacter sp.]|nr:hypothetical protein [Roseateles sp.]